MSFIRSEARKKRHFRVRKKIMGTAVRPRLNIFKSNTSFYAQIIDDVAQKTIVGISSLKIEGLNSAKNIEAAAKLGTMIAEAALAKNVKVVVFDRGGYLYHGKIKSFAEAARAAGLQF